MAVVSYDGLYLFPTDIGEFVYLKFTVDTAKAATYGADIKPMLNSFTSLQAGALSINYGGAISRCDTPIKLSEISKYVGKTIEVRTTGIGVTWDAYINNSKKATFLSSSGQSNHYQAGFGILVECVDGFLWMTSSVSTTDNAVFGASLPKPNSPGYFVFDDSLDYIIGFSGANNDFQFAIDTYFKGNPPKPSPLQDTDPYLPGGTSEPGGGTGNFDGTGDSVDIPGLPTLSAASTGFITLFNPSIAQLNELSSFMWSNGFDLATFKKLFADPMDCILGLSIVPVAVPNGENSTVSVGNISTGVTMTKASSQYVTVDCGTLNVNEYWGSYLDYDPYTKVEIYLPYIGTHALSVDDIMGKSVHVVYHVDILSGACAAYVKCGGSVLYTFIGQCSSSIPITGNDWTNVINGVLSIAGAVGSMVATGGASAPMAAGMIASTAVNGLKPNVEKSGSMSGTGGMLGIQTPYLILTRPRQALPKRQNTFTGYPSFITENLGDLSGYTEIEEIHLENISATESELSEIENLLKSGVIF